MRFLLSTKFPKQLDHGVYKEHTHDYLREVSSDSPDETTEVLNELETSDEPIEPDDSTPFGSDDNEGITVATEPSYDDLTTLANDGDADLSSESNQMILIVLGILLAILVIVCCVLACILARIRRKGFCSVDGKNQAACDGEDCEQEGMSMQQSPKESMSSGKSANSRSSDKLLTK